jgi:hypothetical protein
MMLRMTAEPNEHGSSIGPEAVFSRAINVIHKAQSTILYDIYCLML